MKKIVWLLLAIVMVGCGGGGGGSDSGGTVNNTPVAPVQTSVVDGNWQRTVTVSGLPRLAETYSFTNGAVEHVQYTLGNSFFESRGTFTVSGNSLVLHYTSSRTGTLPATIGDVSTSSPFTPTNETYTETFTIVGNTLTIAANGIYLEKVFTRQ